MNGCELLDLLYKDRNCGRAELETDIFETKLIKSENDERADSGRPVSHVLNNCSTDTDYSPIPSEGTQIVIDGENDCFTAHEYGGVMGYEWKGDFLSAKLALKLINQLAPTSLPGELPMDKKSGSIIFLVRQDEVNLKKITNDFYSPWNCHSKTANRKTSEKHISDCVSRLGSNMQGMYVLRKAYHPAYDGLRRLFFFLKLDKFDNVPSSNVIIQYIYGADSQNAVVRKLLLQTMKAPSSPCANAVDQESPSSPDPDLVEQLAAKNEPSTSTQGDVYLPPVNSLDSITSRFIDAGQRILQDAGMSMEKHSVANLMVMMLSNHVEAQKNEPQPRKISKHTIAKRSLSSVRRLRMRRRRL